VLGWNQWGPYVEVRGLLDEQVSQRFTQAGVQVIKTVRFFAPLETVCPAGSKLILPSGEAGYCTAAARKDGGRLPVPSHLEVWIDVGSVAGPPAGETVVLLRRTLAAGKDRWGNDRYTTAEVPIGGAAVRQLTSAENDAARRDAVDTSIEVILPPGTVVTTVDRLRVRGLVYQVEGEPEELVSSMTGQTPGVRVVGRRVTG